MTEILRRINSRKFLANSRLRFQGVSAATRALVNESVTVSSTQCGTSQFVVFAKYYSGEPIKKGKIAQYVSGIKCSLLGMRIILKWL
jgi:hypothetical protein